MGMNDIRNKRKGNSGIIGDGFKKLSTDDVVGKTLTVVDVDYITTKTGTCGVMIFKEIPNAFYFTGTVLTNLVTDIIADESALDEVRKSGVKISIFKATSEKTGRDYVTFDFA